MSPDEYQKVKVVFQSALEIELPKRAIFLDESCRDNDDLRREVERLLKNYDGDFLEEPAVQTVADLVVGDSLETGEQIGRYEILYRLGKGGAGEVYLARDRSLARNVAVKVLLPEFTSDKERVKRFRLEARSASALNHPNILTIYEIGEDEDKIFIAAEHIKGETLRSLIARKTLTLASSVKIAEQIASALASAHHAGIIHRDVKPENVMVREDGFVKVLDFGLAKPIRTAVESTTGNLAATKKGIVMGSVGYMSPEQARGLETDARTDLWSLGAVFYEMLTGTAPFQAETMTDILANIIHKEPPPISEQITEAPAELYRIVKKSLRKDADARYQTAKDFSLDLKNLRREMELEHELEIAVSPQRRQSLRSGGGKALPTGAAQRKHTNEVEETATQSSEIMTRISGAASLKKPATGEMDKSASGGGLDIAEVKPFAGFFGGYRKSVAAAVVPLVVIVIVLGVYRVLQTIPDARSQEMKLTRLTRTGNIFRAAISPDGKYAAFVARDAEKQSLWVRQVATDGSVQIVPPVQALYWGLAFSPDGNHIYFVRAEAGSKPAIYQIAVFGGQIKKLIEAAHSPFAVSPDGKKFAFVRGSVEEKASVLILANADGSGERTLATRRAPDFFFTHWDGIAWSPDGKTIALHAGGTDDGGDYYRNVVAVRVEDGTEKQITSKRWKWIGGLAWLADGSGLFLSASDNPGGWDTRQIWQIAYPDGEAQRITNDLSGYFGMSLTADAATVLTVQETSFSNLWILPGAKVGQAKPLAAGDSGGQDGLVWTPDGKIVYTSKASGGSDLHLRMMDADGGNQKALTTGSGVREEPAVSADGRYIVFSARASDSLSANIWRIDIDGGNPKQLTRGGHDARPHISPDGKWVIYTHRITPVMPTLWKVPLEGGEPVQLHGEFTFGNAVSPDGMLIACGYRGQKSNGQNKIALLPVSGGPPVKLFDLPPGISPYGHIQWTPDGKSLTASSPSITKIWMQPLDGSPAKELIDFQSDLVWRFAWSPDGSQLAVARGSTVSDVALISHFR